MPGKTMPPGAAFVIAMMLLCAAGFVLMLAHRALIWHDARRFDEGDQARPRRAPRRRPALRRRPIARPIMRTVVRTAPEPEPARSANFPLPNGLEPQSIGSENPAELALNAAEVIAVARMIEHNRTAAKPSKTSTIQAGFGLSRGGGPRYTRAALIYDTLFGPPAPAVAYRELTPEHKAQLQLKQKGALN